MKFLAAACITLNILLIASSATATSNLTACYEDWPPYMFKDEDGTHKGPAITLIRDLSQRLNVDITLNSAPYARCLRDVSIGQKDMIVGVSGQNENIINTALPIVFWNLVPMVRSDSKLTNFDSLEQFNGQTVLIESTFTYPDEILNWLKNAKVKTRRFHYGEATTESNLQPFRIIEGNEADVFFEDEGWLETQISRHRPNVKLLSPAVVTDPNFLGFATQNKHLVSDFNRALSKMFEDGTIVKTYQQDSAFDWMAAYRRAMK